MLDRFGRPIRDLRISVTDRCNFRCSYCMPGDRVYKFLPKHKLLSFEELELVTKTFALLGVRKIRITGGEPLLRKDLHRLIAAINEIDGIDDIALTTNGSLLSPQLANLKAAGLRRITFSLDSLNDATFGKINGRDTSAKVVLNAIDQALAMGFPVKINTVVQRHVNDSEILSIIEHFRGTPVIVRFIEFMDVGNVNGWNMEHVVPSAEVLARINAIYPSEPICPSHLGEVASRQRFCDGSGEFGLISSVTQPFCGSCNRARLTASGELHTCLFSRGGHDLKMIVREHSDQLKAKLIEIWEQRNDRYSEIRGRAEESGDKVEMFNIGG